MFPRGVARIEHDVRRERALTPHVQLTVGIGQSTEALPLEVLPGDTGRKTRGRVERLSLDKEKKQGEQGCEALSVREALRTMCSSLDRATPVTPGDGC